MPVPFNLPRPGASAKAALIGRLAQALPGGIRARLFFLIALVLLPLLLLLGWISYQRYESRRTAALQTEMEVARGIATAFSLYVEGIQQQNYAVGQAIIAEADESATSGENTALDSAATRMLTRTVTHLHAVRNLSWASPTGIILASSQKEMVGQDISIRLYFQQLVAGKPWAIGNLTSHGIVSNNPTLAIATAIRDERGALRGVVVTGIEPTRLGELILTQQRPDSGGYSIFDRQGVLVYNSPETPLTWEERTHWQESDPILQQVIRTGQEQTGITQLALSDGKWVVARVPVPSIGFVAGARRPVEVALTPVQRSLIQDALIALLVAGIACLSAALLAQTIARPLYRLEQDAQAMGAGKIEPREDPQAPTEVRSLRGTVENMATRLIQHAEALGESEARFRVLFHNRHSPMLLIDPASGAMVDANPAATTFYGWTREELLAMKISDINTLPAGKIREEMSRAQAIETNIPFHFVHRLASGETRDVEVHSGPIHWGDKEYLFSIVQDITGRNKAEQALKQSENQLRAIVDNLTEGLIVSDMDGNLLEWNRAALQMHEMASMEEARHQLSEFNSIFELSSMDGTVLSMKQWPLTRILNGETIRDMEASIRRIGTGWQRIFNYGGALVSDEQGRPMMALLTITDITERKLAELSLRASEAHLRESEAQLRGLVEANIIGVVSRDIDGKLLDANDAFVKMVGYTCSEVRAGNLHTHALVPEEYLPLEKQIVDEVLATGSSRPYEKEYIHKDGRRIPILIGYTRLAGSADQLIGFVLDLTELKKAQAALAEYTEKLKHSNQELEQFAFIASHDLQEPLRKIRMFGNGLREKLAREDVVDRVPEEAIDYLDRMQNAAERMQKMINGLLELSRVSTRGRTFEPVVLTQIAVEAVSDLEARIQATGGRVHIEPLPTAEVDQLQIRQLFQNLVGNALKFHKPDVPPLIEVSGIITRSWNGSWVDILVKDNGIGFEEQYAERIFQPFQRLHGRNEYEGTGLGLAICNKIVERHHGKIEVHSKPGEGSTFVITLPLQQIE